MSDASPEPAAHSASLPTLRCLGGRPAPPDLLDGALRLLALPPLAKQRLWELLPPILEEPMPHSIERSVERFIDAHQLSGVELPRGLRAARILLREASALDLTRAQLADDMSRLTGGADLGELLLPGFEHAKARIRAGIVRSTLAETGKVLEAIRWRVDVLAHCDRALSLRMPVVTLVLCYRDNGKSEQIALQVLPDLLQELQRLCDRVLVSRNP